MGPDPKIIYVERTGQDGIFHVWCIKNIGGHRTIDYLVDVRSNNVLRI